MVRSYLAYETYIKEKKKNEMPFYLDWILNWEEHKGMLEIADPELLAEDGDKGLESFVKNNEAITMFSLTKVPLDEDMVSKLVHILTSFNGHQIDKLVLRENGLTRDYFFKLETSISSQEYLEFLEISYNQIDSGMLDIVAKLFPSLPSLRELNLQHNKIEDKGLEEFFFKITEDLELKVLDLSYNLIDDAALKSIIKSIFKDNECTVSRIRLTGNKFSPQGMKSLHKAQRLCRKAANNTKNVLLELGMVPCSAANVSEILKGEHDETFEIVRRPLGEVPKEIPIRKEWKELIAFKQEEIKLVMAAKAEAEGGPTIEDIRDILTKIQSFPFEFPIAKLEAVSTFVEKSLQQALQHDNVYCLEILLECAKIVGMDNLRGAEERLKNLRKRCEQVNSDLSAVLNMERADDNELNEILDVALAEADKLGVRGELVDTCLYLQTIRNKYVQEMRARTDDNSDDEGKLSGTDDEQKIDDVFDAQLDKYIEKSPAELGLAADEDPNLAFHPYRADYIAISQLRPERVRQNLEVALDTLKHEESYAYSNIANRAQFLLCASFFEHAWGLAKNDKCLTIARFIFRYRNNLDNIFEYFAAPEPVKPLPLQ